MKPWPMNNNRNQPKRTYKIIRFFSGVNHSKEVIRTGLTIKEAHRHCRDPETCSWTCTSIEGQRRTEEHGAWFDGYEEESTKPGGDR